MSTLNVVSFFFPVGVGYLHVYVLSFASNSKLSSKLVEPTLRPNVTVYFPWVVFFDTVVSVDTVQVLLLYHSTSVNSVVFSGCAIA